MKFLTFRILGISSSQLTLTPSFFRGVGIPPTSNHQQSHITGKMMITHRNLVPYGTLLSEKTVKKNIKSPKFSQATGDDRWFNSHRRHRLPQSTMAG